MIYASDFRKGMTFDINGEPHVVLDFQHVKPGKGAAFVRTKYRNILTGATREEAFSPSDKFEQAHIDRKRMTYSYNDGELYYFMDPDTYDMVPLNKELVADALRFIKEEDMCDIAFYKGNAFSCEPQNFVELKVIDAEPGIPGATAQPGSKSATLETGYVIQVPLFVNAGETIRVDTRDGSYMSRV